MFEAHSLTIELVLIAEYHPSGQFNKQYLIYMFMGRIIETKKTTTTKKTFCWHVILVLSREAGLIWFIFFTAFSAAVCVLKPCRF